MEFELSSQSFQICVTSSKHGHKMLHFVPIKNFDVGTRARNRGFTKKVGFWYRKINKYTKLFGNEENKNRPPWYHYRMCAQYGGLPPIAHFPSDAKVFVNNLKLIFYSILLFNLFLIIIELSKSSNWK